MYVDRGNFFRLISLDDKSLVGGDHDFVGEWGDLFEGECLPGCLWESHLLLEDEAILTSLADPKHFSVSVPDEDPDEFVTTVVTDSRPDRFAARCASAKSGSEGSR